MPAKSESFLSLLSVCLLLSVAVPCHGTSPCAALQSRLSLSKAHDVGKTAEASSWLLMACLLLVAMPGAPSSVLAPNSDALCS